MSRELLKRALDFIAPHQWEAEDKRACYALVEEIEAALSKPDPDPVAWYCPDDPDYASAFGWKKFTCECGKESLPLYAEQSAREPVTYYCECGMEMMPSPPKPLTDDEIIVIGINARAIEGNHMLPILFARAIEAAHGITND